MGVNVLYLQVISAKEGNLSSVRSVLNMGADVNSTDPEKVCRSSMLFESYL